jgi:hypothetical protein
MTGHTLTRQQLNALSDSMRNTLEAALAPEDEPVKSLRRQKNTTLRKLSVTRLEAMQRLDELTSALYLHGRDTEVMAVGRTLLDFPFSGDYTIYGSVEWILAITALVADRHGDQELVGACRAHIVAVHGEREQWTGNTLLSMNNRLGGFMVEWQERNRPADDKEYTRMQLGELAYLRLWGGSEQWPVDRIDRTFEEKTTYLRQLLKVTV